MPFKIEYQCEKCDSTTCIYTIIHTGPIKKPFKKDDPFMCPQIGCTEGKQANWYRTSIKPKTEGG